MDRFLYAMAGVKPQQAAGGTKAALPGVQGELRGVPLPPLPGESPRTTDPGPSPRPSPPPTRSPSAPERSPPPTSCQGRSREGGRSSAKKQKLEARGRSRPTCPARCGAVRCGAKAACGALGDRATLAPSRHPVRPLPVRRWSPSGRICTLGPSHGLISR